MHWKVISFALFGAALAVPAVDPTTTTTKCYADNCARALTGTQAGLDRPATRIAQCAQFQTTTLIPAVTTTSTSTGTVPTYLTSSCKNPAAYASACSCAGAPAATSLSTIPAPAQTPSTFKIAVKDPAGGVTIAGLSADTQTYGNVNKEVLSVTGTILTYSLNGETLQTTETTPRLAYAFPGDASKLYFSDTGAPSYPGVAAFQLFRCSLGTFDGTVPGYPITCTNQNNYNVLFRQGPGNYGISYAGFNGDAPPPTGGAPDNVGGQLYAVSL